jgi:hypothetical protein
MADYLSHALKRLTSTFLDRFWCHAPGPPKVITLSGRTTIIDTIRTEIKRKFQESHHAAATTTPALIANHQ